MFKTKKATRLHKKSMTILDGFRTAIIKYNEVNDSINVEQAKIEQEIKTLNSEMLILNNTHTENTNAINKITNFLN